MVEGFLTLLPVCGHSVTSISFPQKQWNSGRSGNGIGHDYKCTTPINQILVRSILLVLAVHLAAECDSDFSDVELVFLSISPIILFLQHHSRALALLTAPSFRHKALGLIFCVCTPLWDQAYRAAFLNNGQRHGLDQESGVKLHGRAHNGGVVGYMRLQWLHAILCVHEQQCYSCNQVQWGVTSRPSPCVTAMANASFSLI